MFCFFLHSIISPKCPSVSPVSGGKTKAITPEIKFKITAQLEVNVSIMSTFKAD